MIHIRNNVQLVETLFTVHALVDIVLTVKWNVKLLMFDFSTSAWDHFQVFLLVIDNLLHAII